ncbi:PREDICTED: uncharacterized protein At4g02000-like [Ipomoea nil]|uniref:uncharacterized protein At4g02000-like n=1 Tax=Ipomoea nil TaxID=35883 RepID=UPI000900BC78|nr:PREDICTED: uncharacterized protein At4g02000-like [Ipomoea nil]
MDMFAVALTDELFLFQFPHLRDLQRVVDDGPWSFENNLLICEQVPVGMRPEDVQLDSVPFWIQVHGLPAMYASTEFVTKIGNYIGTFIAADPFNFGGSWKSYYRIRVRMNVAAPLQRRMKLKCRDGSLQWITFKYERLSTFCYCCGMIGHSDKFCRTVYDEGILPDAFPYGPWMRARPKRQVKPVGARWLLSNSGTWVRSSALPPPGPPPSVLEEMEALGEIQGDLKRRREDVDADPVGTDITMVETSKNVGAAGLADQARLDR